jgi:hypothetical protein
VKRVKRHFKVLVFCPQLDVVLEKSVRFNFEVEKIVRHIFHVFLM